MMGQYKCEQCHDTGWYGDNGPGIKGNSEYVRCECRATPPDALREAVLKELQRHGSNDVYEEQVAEDNKYSDPANAPELQWVSAQELEAALAAAPALDGVMIYKCRDCNHAYPHDPYGVGIDCDETDKPRVVHATDNDAPIPDWCPLRLHK